MKPRAAVVFDDSGARAAQLLFATELLDLPNAELLVTSTSSLGRSVSDARQAQAAAAVQDQAQTE